MKYRQDEPEFQDFVNALDPVNATADASPGFVWRMVSDEADSDTQHAFEHEGWLVNMSVWQGLDDLKRFISSPKHLAIMRRREEWFKKSDVAYIVLWWVPAGHQPDFEEAMEHLEHLRQHGPTPHAFNFSQPFDPP